MHSETEEHSTLVLHVPSVFSTVHRTGCDLKNVNIRYTYIYI